jgi:pyruvate ferredoxin oxidoreductase alpha subunit
MDRSCSFGANGGPLFLEIRHAMYDLAEKPQIVNYIYGLGGRDLPPTMIAEMYNQLQKIAKTGQVKNVVQYFGVRE